MLKAGARVFLELGDSEGRHLAPGTLLAASEDACSVELSEVCDLDPRGDLLLYYDDLRMFVQQPARIETVRGTKEHPIIDLIVIGDPVSAERRTAGRVSAAGTNIVASLDGSEFSEVLEVSPRGFAVSGNLDVEQGSQVDAILRHGSEHLTGSVSVRSVRDYGDGRQRYGVFCVDGLLKFALLSVNLQIQREHLKRMIVNSDSGRERWSLPPLRSITACNSEDASDLLIGAGESAPENGEEADPEVEPQWGEPDRPSARNSGRSAGMRRVLMQFRNLLAFEQEFKTNIAHGGIFIPTTESFSVRERIEVELDLSFCGHLVVLEAQVVRSYPPDLAAAGGRVGVAVQFVESAGRLRHLLSEIAGVDAPENLSMTWSFGETGIRRHRRTEARIAAIIEVHGKSRPAHTRNLSRSGAAIVSDGDPLPIGEEIDLTLVDPHEGQTIRLNARVVRHMQYDQRVTCMGVRFSIDPDAQSPLTHFLDRVQSAEQPRPSGRIAGSIATLGLPNLLQMFAVCVDEGTIGLTRAAETAQILFEGGALRYCRAGACSGLKALARLLDWSDGEFEFEARIAMDEAEGIPIPIENALLECSHQVDALHNIESYPLPEDGWLVRGRAQSKSVLERTELEVLDLVDSGVTVRDVLDRFPVYDTEIYRVLDGLLSRGLLDITR